MFTFLIKDTLWTRIATSTHGLSIRKTWLPAQCNSPSLLPANAHARSHSNAPPIYSYASNGCNKDLHFPSKFILRGYMEQQTCYKLYP